MKGSSLLVLLWCLHNLLAVAGNYESDFLYNEHCSDSFFNQSLNAYFNVKYFSGPTNWIIQSQKVCYGIDVTEEGYFRIRGNRTIVAIRLLHLSGDLTCKTNPSNWGCRQDTCVSEYSCHGTRIKRNQTNQEFPDNHAKDNDGLYNFPGFTIDDDLLIIKLRDWPTKVYDGEIFYVYYHGYRGTGIHCVRAEASFLSC